MKYLKNYFLFEYVKNKTSLEWYIKDIMNNLNSKDIQFDYEVESDNDDYITLELFDIDFKDQEKVKKYLEIKKRNLLELGIVLSFNYVPADKFYKAAFDIYLKELYVERVKPSRYVYHTTSKTSKNELIKEKGLMPMVSSNWSADLEYPPAIFAAMSDDPREWFNYGINEYVWRIDTTVTKNKWWRDLNIYQKTFGWIMTFEPIPKEALYLMTDEDISKLAN